jgi:hypothetical protein
VSLLTPEDLDAVLLSLKVAAIATLAALPVAFGVALALARGRFPGRSALDALVHLPLVVDARGEKLSKQTGAPALDGRHADRAIEEIGRAHV